MTDRHAYVGTASWGLPKADQDKFPQGSNHLMRYAGLFNGVEINSSFYRPHRLSTYQRWAADVPDHFRFAVKMPRIITHENRLAGCDEALRGFLSEVAGLREKLGPILVQLPPSLPFGPSVAGAFLKDLRLRFDGDLVCEPRHASWFTNEVDAFLAECRIARVAADPRPHPDAGDPGGWTGLVYYRLHGSPKIYYSAYSDDVIAETAHKLLKGVSTGAKAWCIFDNTAAFAATGNALALVALLRD